MKRDTVVGIEFGELGMRAAYLDEGQLHPLSLNSNAHNPLILFDKTHSISSLGVSFPSLHQALGSDKSLMFQNRQDTAEGLVGHRLRSIRDNVKVLCGVTPKATVIAVPAALTQRRRQILLECARVAQFEDVSLVDRSLAVALGIRADKKQPESGTYVVFHMDYGDCEYALVRVARGRCWTLGSGEMPRASGERLDAMVMEDIVLALRNKNMFLGLKQYASDQWHEFRRIAEAARLRLAKQQTVDILLSQSLSGANGSMTLRLDARGYVKKVSLLLAPTIDGIAGLLEQHGLEQANLDAVLLVGEHAKLSPVCDLVNQAFPNLAVLAEENLIAYGSTAQAAETSGAGVTLPPSYQVTAKFKAQTLSGLSKRTNGVNELAKGVASFTTVLGTGPVPQSASRVPLGAVPPINSSDRFVEVRSLLAQGRHAEATVLFNALTEEMEAIKEQLERSPSRAEQLIKQAQALLVDGAYFQAVSLSHEAYNLEPRNRHVFAAMMKIHADAGLALDRPEQFEEAIKVLACAHSHDQTDRTIHRALAERHYRHAAHMKHLNNLEQARSVTQAALAYDPKHPGANELLTELMEVDSARIEEDRE